MLLAGLQPGNKTKTFDSMLKTTTILTLTPELFSIRGGESWTPPHPDFLESPVGISKGQGLQT